MTTVKEIKKTVEHLSPEGLSQFRKWFEEFKAAAWDQQIEADAKAGRLDMLVNEARSDYKAGKTLSM